MSAVGIDVRPLSPKLRLAFSGKPKAIAAELTPKTGLHDFFTSRSRHQPQHNGVNGMDINPQTDPSDWFRIDDDYVPMIAAKKELLKQHGTLVSVTLPDGEAGARELLEIMADYLPQHFPDRFAKTGRILENKATGDQYDLDNLPQDPMAVAGLLVQEDLVMLHERSDGKLYLTSGSLSFPSGWSLKEKLGQSLEDIHGSVTQLNERIGVQIEQFLKRLKPEKPFWRVNFLVSSSPEWTHMPDVPASNRFKDGEETTDANVERLYLRNEREVFARMPKTGDTLFSLRTYITPFLKLPAVVAHKLAEVLKSLPQEHTEEYKDWSPSERAAIIRYLEQT